MNMSEYIDFSSFADLITYYMSFVHTVIAFATSYIFCGTEQNDVDSIIIEEFAHYCFSSHFSTHPIALICPLSLNLESSFVSFPSRTAS